MNGIPDNIEELLGVNQIRSWIQSKCKSEYGANLVQQVKFSSRVDQIKLWLDQTAEMMRMISSQQVPNQHFYDLEAFLKKIKVEGTYLKGEDYLSMANSIRSLDDWLSFFQKEKSYTALENLAFQLSIDVKIADTIDGAIHENGKVRNVASAELAQLRKQLVRVEQSVRSALHHILNTSIANEFSPQESKVTLRDGRLVMPMKVEYKRSLPGLIHDESATGHTVYIEPAEVLELNNEVRELKNRERKEVIRVLISLADELRIQYQDIKKGSRFLSRLDFIYAKAAWALEFNAVIPSIDKNPVIKLDQAIHPVLWKTHQKSNKVIVPLDILVNSAQRMVVVSGPNAGGKSVVLKTIGLLQYLVQCGIPVPVQEHSTFGIFNEILLDIGDTQSIEDDLSTYSAHLSAMKKFVQRASKRSLVLIDEFGKGTEPQCGGAIAEAILENLHQSGCFGIVTTHYQNLKDLTDRYPAMVNAAMQYDIDKLEPLFLLEIGQPGSSFAFEIARKIGLSHEIIQSAQSKMGQGKVDFDKSLHTLEKEKQKYMKLASKLEKEEKNAVQSKKDYVELRELLVQEKKSALIEAKGEAKRIIKEANKQVEKTIRDIKEHQADKKRTQLIRQRLDNFGNSFEDKIEQKKPGTTRLSVGDYVRLDEQEEIGEIVEIKKKDVQVQFGLLKLFVKLNRLTIVKDYKNEPRLFPTRGVNMLQKQIEFSHELSIRGMRVEEALPKIDAFVDEAIVLGISQVKVIHGKGYGILRDLLRNHLSDHPSIEKIEDEHIDRGGSGISILTFK